MRWLNGEYLKAMTDEEFFEVAKPYIDGAVEGMDVDEFELAKLMRTRVDVLGEISEKLAFLKEFGNFDANMYVHQKMKVDLDVAKRAVAVALEALRGLEDWSEDGVKECVKAAAEQNGLKGGQVMFSMRVALTDAAITPGGAIEMALALKKRESIRRLEVSLAKLNEQ